MLKRKTWQVTEAVVWRFCNFIENKALAQVFSSEFSKISKNTYFLQNTFGGYFWSKLV